MSQETASASKVPDDISVNGEDSPNTLDGVVSKLQEMVEQNCQENNKVNDSIQSQLNEKADMVDRALKFLLNMKRAKSSQCFESQQIQPNEENDRILKTLTPGLQELVNKSETADLAGINNIIDTLMRMKCDLLKAKHSICETTEAAAKNNTTHENEQHHEIVTPPASVPKSELTVKDVLKKPNKKLDTKDQLSGKSSERFAHSSSSRNISHKRQPSEISDASKDGEASAVVKPEETLNQLHNETEAKEKSNKTLSSELAFEKEKSNKLASEIFTERENNATLTEELQSVKNRLKKIKKDKTNDVKKWKKKFEAIKLENEKYLQDPSDVSAESFSSSNKSTSDSALAATLECFATQSNSSGDWRIRYDEVCSKLETSEKSLEVQQEMNARITASVAETRQKYFSEISDLKEVIRKMSVDAEHHENELSQLQVLERTKLDVLINVLEEEKRKLRESNDVLKRHYETNEKKFKDKIAELKRRRDRDAWKMKKAAKAEEKRRNSSSNDSKLDESSSSSTSSNEVPKVVADLTRLQVLVNDGFSDTSAEMNELLISSIKAITDMTIQLDSSLKEFDDQALDALSNEEQEAISRDARANYNALQKTIKVSVEKEDAYAKRWQALEDQEKFLHEERKLLEQEIEKLQKREKIWIDEKVNLEMKTSNLKKELDQANLNFEKQTEETMKLQKTLDMVSKKPQESPKKDRAAQLESRLETIQSSAKAQQQRLEHDLANSRAETEKHKTQSEELQLTNKQLQQKALSAEETCFSLSQKIEENVKSISELRKTVSVLEDENKNLMFVNGEERAGLVHELVVTQEKLKQCQKAVSGQAPKSDEFKSLEEQLKIAKSDLEEIQKRDAARQQSDQNVLECLSPSNEMFPDLDPLLRQLVHILAGNQNYMYGALGIVAYIFLIHLYILL